MARKYEISAAFGKQNGKQYSFSYNPGRKQKNKTATIYLNCKDGTVRITPTQIFKLKTIEGKLR